MTLLTKGTQCHNIAPVAESDFDFSPEKNAQLKKERGVGFMDEELSKALNRGQLKRSRGTRSEIRLAREAAANYLKKDSRINIRLSGTDLDMLKRKAAEEGLPYQTLISSVLHKFVSGRLLSR